jgi:hypothetical protein
MDNSPPKNDYYCHNLVPAITQLEFFYDLTAFSDKKTSNAIKAKLGSDGKLVKRSGFLIQKITFPTTFLP